MFSRPSRTPRRLGIRTGAVRLNDCQSSHRIVIPTGAKRSGEPGLSEVEWQPAVSFPVLTASNCGFS